MNDFSINTMISELAQINETLKSQDIRKLEIDIFTQEWSNTSGGFQSMGGAAFIRQNTFVISHRLNKKESKCHVFFGGRYAYSVIANDVFLNDLNEKRIVGCKECKKRYVVCEFWY
jgi:hypothetical protein